MNSLRRTQRESETLVGGCSAGTKLWVFPHNPSLLCLSPTKPETANPLVLWVHGHLAIPGKSRNACILMTTRSQVSAMSLPVLTNAAEGSDLQRKMSNVTRWMLKHKCELYIVHMHLENCQEGSSKITHLAPVALPQATQSILVPGMRDAGHPDPVPGVRDTTHPDPVPVPGKPLFLFLVRRTPPSLILFLAWKTTRSVPRSVPEAQHLDLSLGPPLSTIAAPPDLPVPVPGVEEAQKSLCLMPGLSPWSLLEALLCLKRLPLPFRQSSVSPDLPPDSPASFPVSPFVSVPVPICVSILVPVSVYVPVPLSLACFL
ncbi:hypothetical protein P4O66_005329 [Electrophorus voltai]|uniref:Uncharacterized protein n=1 Tax=Electrophorus voltai TaxID=2609070 RepID=A0AAD8ZXJ3_9TELE|nr:hypothetical protein P4O66_005329 [Electrophorus voltai]